ncbi:DUF4832 domain-containing protein [Hymenobacter weizhouensis]|uniref:DUF4832 domain-containing protein n=1 Tax=Hymenobacter sp. YIM 151500-1 TaxID=2987689 RepID=UPI0022278CB6|nr:DUF4832 domain-containing protein [Hymenobacter sp. YIM 151500-1]UYZ64945.1 DUF4832 domain-containing protein [Hymenobacter sp. YIM 151500-1]
MKHVFCGLLTLLLGGAATAQTTTKTYSGTSDIFINPERGFSVDRIAYHAGEALNLSDMQSTRTAGYSWVRRIYNLQDFRSAAISQAYLDMVAADFGTARAAGIKLIVRFTYNWDTGADASKSRILGHIDQLKNVLQANADAIAYVEAGFIGRWGEWHDSTNGLDNTTDRGDILKRLLGAVPASRMVALRYPNHKKQIFNNYNALTPSEAFNQTDRARVGCHNDYFLSDIADGGTFTYGDDQAATRENERAFLSQDNRYVVQGGESGEDRPEFSSCSKSVAELRRMRYSQLNAYWHNTLLARWQTEGCMDEVKRSLGYRFRLTTATLANSVATGATFTASIKVKNDGWASCYNSRGVEVILRNKSTGAKLVASGGALGGSKDPRFWLGGEEHTLSVSYTVPAGTATGQYEVLLNLPDPQSSLRTRPEYAIRLANSNAWEGSTGYNKLGHEVTITAGSTGTAAVADGTYTLTARHSGKRLDVQGNSSADKAQVWQYTANTSSAQRWVVRSVGDGYYTLTHEGTTKCLDVDGGKLDNGVEVWQYEANGLDPQKWKIEPTSDGYYKLTSKASGKCLDVYGGPAATADYDNVVQWEYVGGTNQQWKLDLVSSSSARQATASATLSKGTELLAYPNPSPDGQATLRLSAQKAQTATVQVFTPQGRPAGRFAVPVTAGSTDFALPAGLAPGLYRVQTTLDGKVRRLTLKVE